MVPSILMPLAHELQPAPVFNAVLQLARLLSAKVRAAYIRPDPDIAAAMIPEMIMAGGVTRDVIERETTQAARAAKSAFEEWRNRNGGRANAGEGPGWRAAWSEDVGEYEPIVTRRGRLSDMIVLPSPTAGAIVAQRCADAAIFSTGRPTLLVGDAVPPAVTEHVLIAWNGSLEASRAVFGAMPLLRLASRITIFSAAEYPAEAVDVDDLAIALRAHDIRATPQLVFPTDERSTGAALVSAAEAHRASLIVMGAYTHSRVREAFLGGVTRHLLAHAPAPVLMSH